MIMFLVLYVLFYATGPDINDSTNSSQASQGINIDESDYPFIVSIRLKDTHICGGVIFSERFVLTAGICLDFPDQIKKLKYLTVNACSRSYAVVKFDIHENYKHKLDFKSLYKYDFAVLEVSPEFEFCDTCKPIELYYGTCTFDYCKEKFCNTTGRTYYPGIKPGLPKLFYKTVKIVSSHYCNNSYEFYDNTNICVFNNQTNYCWHDKGNPLICDGVLYGITSSRAGDKCEEHYILYSSVVDIFEWIQTRYQTDSNFHKNTLRPSLMLIFFLRFIVIMLI